MPVTYDIVISSPFSNYNYFSDRMMELCGQMGLSFFFVNDVWVNEFTEKLVNGESQRGSFWTSPPTRRTKSTRIRFWPRRSSGGRVTFWTTRT